MAGISLAGVVLTFYAIARFRPGEGRATLEDVLAAAASVVHTVPPVGAGSRRQDVDGSSEIRDLDVDTVPQPRPPAPPV
jgi:hypothetical protein